VVRPRISCHHRALEGSGRCQARVMKPKPKPRSKGGVWRSWKLEEAKRQAELFVSHVYSYHVDHSTDVIIIADLFTQTQSLKFQMLARRRTALPSRLFFTLAIIPSLHFACKMSIADCRCKRCNKPPHPASHRHPCIHYFQYETTENIKLL